MENKYRITFKIENDEGHVGLYVYEIDEVITYPEDALEFIQRARPDLIKTKINVERISSIPFEDKHDESKRIEREESLYNKINDYMKENKIIGFIWENLNNMDSFKYPEHFSK
ncbi:hypothetical protein [Aeromonas jandaei]|uniref:hypothetical protein n=1 Tax=Aeromonas jandaei TaxID=650 RepID=UPI001115AD59|nr:hypothetical protein [Aeromonas jandaei]TNH95147.1 hypothetical protein CF104_20005 [Aeromonas jandaei]